MIDYGYGSAPPPASFIDHLCMNETLENINCIIQKWKDDRCPGEPRANHSMCIGLILNGSNHSQIYQTTL